ncbi:MAG: hypothetical protein IJV82_00515 [Oscillospiraceae bacterium]|nr:hypothetical protein [Oscillospiraceae bacterium]
MVTTGRQHATQRTLSSKNKINLDAHRKIPLWVKSFIAIDHPRSPLKDRTIITQIRPFVTPAFLRIRKKDGTEVPS